MVDSIKGLSEVEKDMYKGQAETCRSFSLTVLICDRSTQINYVIVRICITIVIQRKR